MHLYAYFEKNWINSAAAVLAVPPIQIHHRRRRRHCRGEETLIWNSLFNPGDSTRKIELARIRSTRQINYLFLEEYLPLWKKDFSTMHFSCYALWMWKVKFNKDWWKKARCCSMKNLKCKIYLFSWLATWKNKTEKRRPDCSSKTIKLPKDAHDIPDGCWNRKLTEGILNARRSIGIPLARRMDGFTKLTSKNLTNYSHFV